MCDDFGICSNTMMSTDADNSIDFLISSLNSGNLECLDNNSGDLLDDFELEPTIRNRCNTWPTRHPTEFHTNDSLLMHENM
jgi:hypothetical protein